MEDVDEGGQYVIKGGNTIMGYLFAYQEKTGMGLKEIMKTPWLMIVLGMLTAPSVDYEASKEKKKTKPPVETPDDEINVLQTFLV